MAEIISIQDTISRRKYYVHYVDCTLIISLLFTRSLVLLFQLISVSMSGLPRNRWILGKCTFPGRMLMSARAYRRQKNWASEPVDRYLGKKYELYHVLHFIVELSVVSYEITLILSRNGAVLTNSH